jgi:hypothetical protein
MIDTHILIKEGEDGIVEMVIDSDEKGATKNERRFDEIMGMVTKASMSLLMEEQKNGVEITGESAKEFVESKFKELGQ